MQEGIDYVLQVARWIVAVPTGLLFIGCALANWSLIIGGLLNLVRGRETCFILVLPFMGPLFGLAFFLAIPAPGFARWCWLAAVLEPSWLLGAWVLAMSLFPKRRC